MSENLLRSGLHRAVDGIEVPQDLWTKTQQKRASRAVKRKYLRRASLVAAILLLAIALPLGSITAAVAKAENSWLLKNELGTFTLTMVQNFGEKVAEITPTMFLPTTLSHAKQVAKIPIKLPTYLPAGVTLNDDTPTLVGRIGSTETVAIRVTEHTLIKDPLTGKTETREVDKLDIRQTNAPDVSMVSPPRDLVVQRVKIGEYDGLMALENFTPPKESLRVTIRETEGQRTIENVESVPNVSQQPQEIPLWVTWSDGKYWYRVSGGQDRETLLKIAESMK